MNLQKTKFPKVSIITTVWNLYQNDRVESFRQMMESVHNQHYPNIEHIVVDNNSTDETKDLINEFVNKGWITKVCFEKKQGLWHGMNKGLEEATGEFVNFMNSDDYFYRNDAVELSVKAILDQNADWSFGYANKVNPKNGEIVFKWHFDDYASIYNARCPNHQTLFVRTNLLREQGGFETKPEFGGTFSDDLSMMRLLFSGHIPALVPEVLVIFRDGGASSNIGRANTEKYVDYVRNEFGFYELSKSELDSLFWENEIKHIDETSFKILLDKISIQAWRKRLTTVYGKDFPAVKIKTVTNASTEPQISIIVPIYNAECFVRRGIVSLLNQTFENIEILCINDGSTDNTLQILEELKSLDPRLKVFNQKNSGPATARNVGLKNARGHYIMFMDADDSYEPNMCQDMLQTIKDKSVDVVMCNTSMIGKDYGNYPFPFGSGKSDIDYNIRKKVNVWLWNKIFKTKIIKDYDIKFPDGHKSDDDVFIAQYFAVAKNIYCLDKKLINHFRTENSIMEIYNSAQPNKVDIFDHISALENIIKFTKKHLKGNDCIEYTKHIFKMQLYWSWRNVGTEIENEYLDLLKNCIKNIGQESVPESVLYNAVMKNEYKLAANIIDFFAEQFTGIQRKKYLFQKKIEPIFKEDFAPIIFSCDNNYCKYCSVALQSIIENASPNRYYDIIILEENITDTNKRTMQSQLPKNFSLRFYNMKAITEKYKLKSWFYTGRLSPEAYFRLFIPEILQNYKKCIYLDSDVIIQTDIYELYQIELGDALVGAVRDVLQMDADKQEYFINHLKMKDPKNNYFNTGVLLLNLGKLKLNNCLEKFLYFAKINNRLYHDQNVLNAALEGKVKYLSPKWNAITSSWLYKEYHTRPYLAPFEHFSENMSMGLTENIYIIHYATWTKPWQQNIPFAYVWWEYARKTPFYEILLKSLLENMGSSLANSNLSKTRLLQIISYKSDKIRYWRYKLLSKITFGKMRKHYKNKRKQLKNQLKEIRKIIKSK